MFVAPRRSRGAPLERPTSVAAGGAGALLWNVRMTPARSSQPRRRPGAPLV